MSDHGLRLGRVYDMPVEYFRPDDVIQGKAELFRVERTTIEIDEVRLEIIPITDPAAPRKTVAFTPGKTLKRREVLS